MVERRKQIEVRKATDLSINVSKMRKATPPEIRNKCHRSIWIYDRYSDLCMQDVLQQDLRFFLQIEEIEVEVLSSDRRDRGAEEGEGVGCSGSAAR